MRNFLMFGLLSIGILTQNLRANAVSIQEFRNWWLTVRDVSEVPEDLRNMEDYFVSTELLDRCSKYWLFLNQKNIEQIISHGYENFKQTVACNYFTWLVDCSHNYSKNLLQEDQEFLRTVPRSELIKKHAWFTVQQSIQYNYITAKMYYYLIKHGAGPFLEMLEEPSFGSPPSITIEGKSLSQDVLNSLLEYNEMHQGYDLSKISTVLEVGAGSGRTAFCFLQLMPHIKYIIVDIPPALYLSQRYLSDVFSKRKVFKFRAFERFEDIREEFLAADMIFMTPDQMQQLPDRCVDLFLAIDCLHEMKQEEVKFFVSEADRLASLFYFKCWKHTVVPFDGLTYAAHDYPIPAFWEKIFERDCVVPSDFFHAFYKVALKS